MHAAHGREIVLNRVMLGGAVVPHGHITLAPLPAHGVFEARDALVEELQQRAELLTGTPDPIEFTDRVVAVVRYRDGSVIDVIHQVKSAG